jgi:hypothetical protein
LGNKQRVLIWAAPFGLELCKAEVQGLAVLSESNNACRFGRESLAFTLIPVLSGMHIIKYYRALSAQFKLSVRRHTQASLLIRVRVFRGGE